MTVQNPRETSGENNNNEIVVIRKGEKVLVSSPTAIK
jgi:Lhr-like helicase